jgi:hypothetical protein
MNLRDSGVSWRKQWRAAFVNNQKESWRTSETYVVAWEGTPLVMKLSGGHD